MCRILAEALSLVCFLWSCFGYIGNDWDPRFGLHSGLGSDRFLLGMHLVAFVEPICSFHDVGVVLGSPVAGHGHYLLVLNSSVPVPILRKTLGTDCATICSNAAWPCCSASFAGWTLGCRIILGCTLLVHLLKLGNVLIDLVN